MKTQNEVSLLKQKIQSQSESQKERKEREARSLQVARQMLSNGCCINTINRYTGLSEDQLNRL